MKSVFQNWNAQFVVLMFAAFYWGSVIKNISSLITSDKKYIFPCDICLLIFLRLKIFKTRRRNVQYLLSYASFSVILPSVCDAAILLKNVLFKKSISRPFHYWEITSYSTTPDARYGYKLGSKLWKYVRVRTFFASKWDG